MSVRLAACVRSALTRLTQDPLRSQELESIIAALKQTGGKLFGLDGATKLLGMKPTTLASRIKSLGLNPKSVE